jgi:hypothetical protein
MLRSFWKTFGLLALTLSIALGALGSTVTAFAAGPSTTYAIQSGASTTSIFVYKNNVGGFSSAEEWLEKTGGFVCTPTGLFINHGSRLINAPLAAYVCDSARHFDQEGLLFGAE